MTRSYIGPTVDFNISSIWHANVTRGYFRIRPRGYTPFIAQIPPKLWSSRSTKSLIDLFTLVTRGIQGHKEKPQRLLRRKLDAVDILDPLTPTNRILRSNSSDVLRNILSNLKKSFLLSRRDLQTTLISMTSLLHAYQWATHPATKFQNKQTWFQCALAYEILNWS